VAGHDEEVVRALNNLCHLLALERRIEEGVELIAEAIALATDRQLVSFFQCMRGSEAELYLHAGRWDDAVEVVHSVMARTDTATTHRPGPLAVLGKVRARRGDPDPWGPLEEGLHYARVMGEPQNIHPVRMGMVEAAWFAGDLDRARAELVDHLPMAVQMRHRWSHGEVARWALRLGLDDLPPMVVPKAYEPLLAGDPSGTAAAFAAKHCPYDEADALLDSDDVGDLRRALLLFDQLGAKPPMAIASQRLRARGVRRLPRRARPSTRGNPAGLTAREVEVAGLLAEHLTNEQIASRLYLSVKTVDHHVSAVLSKLGVRTRREAARRLAELGGC
jgi:DNA-binding CsgD family transcriptional regulator